MTEQNEQKKTEKKNEKLVEFKGISESQIFCYYKDYLICELRNVSGTWMIYYKSTKLDSSLKKEIEEKWKNLKKES